MFSRQTVFVATNNAQSRENALLFAQSHAVLGLSFVESKTWTHNGRVGSAQRTADGWAGRNWAKHVADISVSPEAACPLCPQGYRGQLFRTFPG